MRINTLKIIFVTATAFYSAALASYLLARKIYYDELIRKAPARLFWGEDAVPLPDLNNWHYFTLVCFCTAIAITLAGISLKQKENRIFLNKTLGIS